MERNGETWYYIYDGHGSVRHLADSNGSLTDSYTYDAYGTLLEKEGITENDFLYAGEQYNAGTGLYYLRARYMDPSTGTFISMDSYQGSIYDPVSLHKYLYANANPVMYTEPSGYMAEQAVALGGRSILEAGQSWYNSVVFGLGMQILTNLRAINEVKTVICVSTMVLVSIILDSALNEGKYININSIVVELWRENLSSIEALIFEANAVNETIAESIKTAIYEAEKEENSSRDKNEETSSENENDEKEYKKPVSNKSGKEAAKDVPSWAKGNKPYKNENGRAFAKRLCDERYGEGNYSTKSQTEFSKIQQWGDRGFE